MSDARQLLDAMARFTQAYGSHPKFGQLVGDIHEALIAVEGASASPGQRAAGKYLQHQELTFNHAGQEPSPRKEEPAAVQAGVQRNSRTDRARGQAPDHRQGLTSYSGNRPVYSASRTR